MLKEILLQPKFIRLVYRATVWHLNYLTNGKVSPLACGFYISNRCNFKCTFCNIWRIKPGYQVTLDEALRIVRELGRMGLIYFSISGGEPLLVPYVFEVLSAAKKSGILYTHLVSNGYLMDQTKAKALSRADVSEISFSVDGNEKTHDENRRVAGAFGKVMEAVAHVRSHSPNTKIILNTILDPVHPENAVFAVARAEQLRVKIKVQPANDHPSFELPDSIEKHRRQLTNDEKIRLLDAIKRIQNSPSLANSSPFLENYKAFIFSPDDLFFKKKKCLFGYHHLEIFSSKLYPCLEGFDWKNGFDISTLSLKDFLKSNAYLEKIRCLEKCTNCQKNYYVCYYEPRLNFPVWNFLTSRLKSIVDK